MGVDDDRSDDEYACRRACRHDVVVVGWSLIALRVMDLGMDHKECCDRALRYKSTKSTTIDTYSWAAVWQKKGPPSRLCKPLFAEFNSVTNEPIFRLRVEPGRHFNSWDYETMSKQTCEDIKTHVGLHVSSSWQSARGPIVFVWRFEHAAKRTSRSIINHGTATFRTPSRRRIFFAFRTSLRRRILFAFRTHLRRRILFGPSSYGHGL